MPWHTQANHPDCPDDTPWAVIKDDDDEVEGCHATEEAANAQVAALYASEDMDDMDETADPVLTAVYDAFADTDAGTANVGAERDPALYSLGYWQGVLVVETVETGDYPRREFADGSLEWRDLPLSIYWQKVTAEGHDNAFIVAGVDEMRRGTVTLKDGRTVPAVLGRGKFNMKQPEGVEAHQLVLDGFMRGVSVTTDDVTDSDVEMIFPEGTEQGPDDEVDDELMMMLAEPEKILFHHARIMDACLTGQPAFQEAQIELVADADWDAAAPVAEPDADAIVAAGGYTSIVVVARPADPDSLAVAGGLPADELHITLGYYGDVADAPDGLIESLGQWVESHGDVDFTARVGGVARMGDDDPQAIALLVEAAELADLRADLESVADPDRTHPHFTPHMTLGYGIDMPDTNPGEARFNRVELWAGDEHQGDAGAVTAASAPVLPPVAWFRNPALPGPTPLTVTDDGRVFGHLAVWGTCHTSFSNVCVTPPRAPQGDYGYYRKGLLRTAEGDDVAVGQLTLGANHAPATLGSAPASQHYENTGHAVADVAAGEDAHGIWVAGATRPHVDDRTVRMLRGGGISGDWRKVSGHWRLVGGLIVNVPGFPIPRIRTHVQDGEQVALVASGMVRRLPANVLPFRTLAEQVKASVGRDVESRAAALRRSVHPTTHHL